MDPENEWQPKRVHVQYHIRFPSLREEAALSARIPRFLCDWCLWKRALARDQKEDAELSHSFENVLRYGQVIL